MDENLNGMKVPIIQPHVDQDLIVKFTKNEQGRDCITFDFNPPISEVRTPAQSAAMVVADHIIRTYALGDQPKKEEVENGEKAGD